MEQHIRVLAATWFGNLAYPNCVRDLKKRKRRKTPDVICILECATPLLIVRSEATETRSSAWACLLESVAGPSAVHHAGSLFSEVRPSGFTVAPLGTNSGSSKGLLVGKRALRHSHKEGLRLLE